jgi:hypothetical protein
MAPKITEVGCASIPAYQGIKSLLPIKSEIFFKRVAPTSLELPCKFEGLVNILPLSMLTICNFAGLFLPSLA